MAIDKKFSVEIRVTLQPVWHAEPPLISIGLNADQNKLFLEAEKEFILAGNYPAGPLDVNVAFLNKKDQDTIPEQNLDKYVIIKSITVNGIHDSKFSWMGSYRPQYPEPWFSQQEPPPSLVLPGHDHLSWNGQWTLTLSVPCFTWMHQTLGLGWIYK
jgi:hypothetical protein